MSKSNFLESEFIEAIFGAGSVTPASNYFISLHTADPGQGGNQTTNEATYGGYARQQIAVPAGWLTGQDSAQNVNDVLFPEATAGSETITHFGVGELSSGVGDLFYLGPLTASVPVTTGVTVKINAGNLVVTED